jgi:hypothetical protein
VKNEEERKPDCPCAYSDCERHGICKKCKEYHHAQGQKTCCEKKKDKP